MQYRPTSLTPDKELNNVVNLSTSSVSQKHFIPRGFLKFFPQRLRILITILHAYYVHIYGNLLNFIQLSINLTELCHIKHNNPVNFHFSLRANCTNFIAKDEWPSNSPDLNPLDYHVWGAMLQAFHKLHSKPETITELKSALQHIWDELPQITINKALKL